MVMEITGVADTEAEAEMAANAANANAPGSSSSGSSSNNNISPASTTHETAGVASMFLSNKSRTTDNDWLCDLGASSSMSSNRLAFSSLRADWRPICLADGRIVYSKGVGSIRFLSNFGYTIVIHGVLFIPFLVQNLFAPNKFARECHDTHMEVMEYPTSRWVNRRTGAMEFTATVCSNDLAYLDWKVAPSVESACVSISELHSWLNHMPHSAVQRLVQSRAVSGILSHIEGTAADDFCEDCVNGKLTQAPHTKPVQLRLNSCFSGCSRTCMVQCQFRAGKDISIGSHSSMITLDSQQSTSSQRNQTSLVPFVGTKRGQRMLQATGSGSSVMIRGVSM
jgi:hypothetical protein